MLPCVYFAHTLLCFVLVLFVFMLFMPNKELLVQMAVFIRVSVNKTVLFCKCTYIVFSHCIHQIMHNSIIVVTRIKDISAL